MRRSLCLSALLLVVSLFASSCFPLWGQAPEGPLGSPPTASSADQNSTPSSEFLTIPSPLRSFLRMAAISQKVSPDEVLPLLARNIVVEGYQNWQDRNRKPTEYLTLLKHYLEQARELHELAGNEGRIHIATCAEAQPLLTILGYRLRQPCGPQASLETADPQRAFLTIDSGFPLAQLEEALRAGTPFDHAFATSQVPVLFSRSDWIASDKEKSKDQDADVIDSLIREPALARLYWALSQMDVKTRDVLRQSPGLAKLVPYAAALDFYGNHVFIRANRVVVPGGAPAEPAWKNLVGVGPDSPGEFVLRLMAKDESWLAAYFDAISRAGAAQQAYLTEPRRLQRFYEALRGKDVSPSASRPVFRPDPGLVLLASRLQFDSDGQPHVPGNLEVWKEILRRKSDSHLVREWAKRASHWNSSEQLVEGMFALSRSNSKDGPVELYLSLSEMDRGRSSEQHLDQATVRLLADKFSRFSNQYLIFSEFGALNNASIMRFMNVAESLDRISDHLLRANAIGIFQANIGLWEILARQEQIPAASWNDSWQQVVNPFATISSPAQLLDASRKSLSELWRASAGKLDLSQAEIIALLAGPNQNTPEGRQIKQELANRIRSVMDAQRLVSIDTLLALGDGLNQMAEGKPMGDALIRLAGELREFEMPKPLFTTGERSEWASGLYNNRHTQLQLRTDLTKVIKSASSPHELAEARGQLTPFLRDALVGLNYAYYEPPGAQMIHNNPLFVRSHDFSGEATPGLEQSWQTPRLYGRGWTASGGAHLAGSLADLPYVLAQVEQDFIIPENVQSLIWQDLVPDLMASAILPRWWRVTRNELHAVNLYQRSGEELLEAATENAELRQNVTAILSDRMLPQRLAEVDDALRAGHREDALSHLMPAEVFYLGAEFRRRFPDQSGKWGEAGQELEALVSRSPEDASRERLSRDFGVPHPALAQTYGRELLNGKPFPTFLGYSSRLLAESWDSNNLYWARLADEMGYAPVRLHRLVPELTHRMVEKIFATHLEDWPAMLRALRETGDEFRMGKVATPPKTTAAAAEF